MRVSRLQRLQRRLVPPQAQRSQRLVPMSRSERSRHADTVWVSGLQREHTSAVLSQYFERFGAVAQVSLPRDAKSGEPLGFGFIKFHQAEPAASLLLEEERRPGELHSTELGAGVTVGPAYKHDPMPSSGKSMRKRRAVATQWFEGKVKSVLQRLRGSPLAAQADATAGLALQKQLTQAVLEGEAPSFDDCKALAHYTLSRLRPRTWYLYSALVAADPVLAAIRRKLFEGRTAPLKVASLAGGPGFDYAAVLLASEFLGCSSQVRCTVYDLERRWEQPLSHVVAALQPLRRDASSASEERTESEGAADSGGDEVVDGGESNRGIEVVHGGDVSFATFDITQPLAHADNARLMQTAADVDLFVVSFVVHECAVALGQPPQRSCGDEDAEEVHAGTTSVQEAGDRMGGVFPQLFAACKPGACFVFTDVTGRLWPAMAACARAQGLSAFCPQLSGTFGTQFPLVLTRGVTPPPDEAGDAAHVFPERFCFASVKRVSAVPVVR